MAKFRSFSQLGGANPAISHFLRPDDTPEILNGVNITQKLGAILKDTGYTQVGDTVQAGKSITGLYDFKQNPSTQKLLATCNNSGDTALQLKYNNAGTWTNITVGATYDTFEDAKAEFESFIGHCFIVGYDSTDNVFLPVASLTGTTFSTSANVTNMAQGKFIVRYRDRLFVLHAFSGGTLHPYRVYKSDIPTAGTLSWKTNSFFDVDYSLEITGAAAIWDKLVIFTEKSFYIYISEPEQLGKAFEVGCSSHRTIRQHNEYLIWANGDGVWMSTGGKPANIAGPVIDFIRNASSPRLFFATLVDEEYRLHVGDVTVDGVSYNNVELRFHIPSSTWTWREYLQDTPTIFAEFNDSGKFRQYMGLADGEVMNKGKYSDNSVPSSDDGAAINANFELAPIHFNEFSIKKGIALFTAFADRAQGLSLKYRVLDRNLKILTPYFPLGKITQFINNYDISRAEDGVMLQVAGSEYSTNPYFSFYGFELDIQKTSDLDKK